MHTRILHPLFALLLTVLFNATAHALELPAVFSNNAVLQHGQPLLVWGWADPGETVTVIFNDQSTSAVADDAGKWQLKLKPLTPSTNPATLTVKGKSQTLTATNILVGDVWLCGGQSNMQWNINQTKNTDVVAAANNPNIRMLTAPRRKSTTRLDRIDATWQTASPQTVGKWSAVGYYFGLKLNKELNVPIGLLSINWGGTRIEPWTSAYGFKQVPELQSIYQGLLSRDPASSQYKSKSKQFLTETERWLKTSQAALDNRKPITSPPTLPKDITPYTSHQDPAMLYRGMIHAFVPYNIKGAIWYQGESNHRETGHSYVHKTRALLESWRYAWDMPNLPYYYVQIAPYHYGSEPDHILPQFWEAQAAIEKEIPNTGMIVISDIGNYNDIHPLNKLDVGNRLANLALHDTYNRTDILARGPILNNMAIKNKTINLTFDNAGTGLTSLDNKPLTHFEIAGNKYPWTEATASITSPNTITLSSPKVQEPVAMRFAWHKSAEPNLVNSAGLPTSAFREGSPPQYDILNILGTLAPETKNYQIVYIADLNKANLEISYDIDNSDSTPAFDRIAYLLELTNDSGTQYAYVSMDAFTDNPKHVGIPTVNSGAFFQQRLKNLNVYTSNRSIPNALNLNGNIEFWSTNYGDDNHARLPKASSEKFDFGDKPSTSGTYGSMQIHLTNTQQTLFAINHWKAGPDNIDIGIGNQPQNNPDWTFSKSGKNYTTKKLTVLVRPKK
ncbi:sialate O-acetylesterase [Poriferisphaera sp. WC338]|uniref:sialate O-acetylesterase n=1 Tax=Poriferisphaera sp. WC338 TaxID=3425129 RepID=UPI003D81BEC5